jgi:hypothetical protein
MVWMPKPELPWTTPFERFNNVLRLDPETGLLWWRYRTGARCNLTIPAGSINKRGYLIIQLFGKLHKAHRIVWLLHSGQWPKNEIDHINRRKRDNRPINLRDVTKSENLKNNPFPNGLTQSGHRGIYPDRGRYQARVGDKHIGMFDTVEQAVAAQEKAIRNER